MLYFIIPARLQLCRTITALCVWNVRATRNDGANRKPNLGILAIKDLEIYVLLLNKYAMKLVFFDLETTGTNPGKHGIHQISGQIVIDGVIKETFDFHVQPNPKALIEDEALKVGNVTREQILAYPPMQQVYQEFVSMLGKYVDKFNKKDKFFLVGYNNAAFDNQFLRGFFLQNGDVYFGSWFWANSIDVMVLASAYLATRRPDMENFKLSTVARTLGVDVQSESLHDAMYDIELTKAVFDIITKIE